MNPIRIILLVAVLVPGAAVALSAADSIPQTFDAASRDLESPIWVSAELTRKKEQKGKRPAVEGDCKVYEKTSYPLARERTGAGFEDMVRSARGIYSASITDLSQGLFLGKPASVLKLEITKVWKAPHGEAPAKELFAVYPFARFAIGEAVFCSGEPGSLHEPKAGQRVILFVTSEPVDRQRTLVWVDGESLISEDSNGKLSLPRSLQNDPELFPIRGVGGLEEILRWMLSRPPFLLARPPGYRPPA